MSYTPGPWVMEGHFVFGPVHEQSRHPNGRVLVAKVVRGSYRADPLLDGGADRFSFDSLHDARLIAAAPELYEALEAAYLVLTSQKTRLEEYADAVALARAALAKARADEGKENA